MIESGEDKVGSKRKPEESPLGKTAPQKARDSDESGINVRDGASPDTGEV